MTCIVGLIDKDKSEVIIGGDSASSSDVNYTVRKDPKVFYVGDFLIGATTSYRMIQLLRYSLSLPDIGDKDIYEYMCTDFVDTVRECFAKGGFLTKSTEGEDIGGQFLVGYKDRLFLVYSDFSVGESARGYESIGCGQDFALGALFVTVDMWEGLATSKVQDSCSVALIAAANNAIGVLPPYIILKTK